ncbi:MAG: phage portal protein [Bacteroidales bacterium]|nr:phage portal protein [Bacteroidales bacterium]
MIYSLNDLEGAKGLGDRERAACAELVNVLYAHHESNALKKRYYEGKERPKTLGISIPDNVRLDVSCCWPEKAVTALRNRSVFDGYVGGDAVDELSDIVRRTRLTSKYGKAVTSELVHGCVFGTVAAGLDGKARVNFHSAETASALWDNNAERISCGLAIIDGKKSNEDYGYRPSVVNLYMDDATWVLRLGTQRWTAERHPHAMGRPMMEPMIYRADVDKPFGRSRITRAVMTLTDDYLREMERIEIQSEFYTNPQRYASGLSQDQLEALIKDKWNLVVGSIMGFTENPDTGGNPVIGQFQQMTMNPHIDYINSLANQFSGATNIPVSDLGVVQSTYISAEAVQTAAANLCIDAEALNASNGAALEAIGMMALAVDRNAALSSLTDGDMAATAHFCDPRKPSLVAQADAMLKAIQAVPKLAQTDYALEQLGVSQADIVRINSDVERAAGLADLTEFEYGEAEA